MASQATSASSSSSISSTSSKSSNQCLSARKLVQFNYALPIRLESHNFLVWKTQFLPAIRGNRLLGFLDGSLPCPSLNPDDPESEEDVDFWHSQDEFIQQLMCTSVF